MTLSLDVTVPARVHAVASADAGAVVAVIGPNGAGKSTLLRAVAGLVACEGDVVVDGRSWSRPPVPVRERSVGLAFQDQLLFPHLTALQNVAFGPRSRGVPRDRAQRTAQDWLDRFAVGDLAGRRPRELSGGQAQRVSIARALATEPRLLLLDEPFAGLDIGVAASLRVELSRHLAAYDGVTLLVTHDAIDALTLADTVWVLDDGRLVQVGPPREVAARPTTEHVARLVGLNVLAHEGPLHVLQPTGGHRVAGGAGGLRPAPLARAGHQPRAARRRRAPPGVRRTRSAGRRDPRGCRRAAARAGRPGVAVGQGDRGPYLPSGCVDDEVSLRITRVRRGASPSRW